jgi:hypothetical protein
MANANDSDTIFRNVLGPNLQGGALRAILILAAFAAIGAVIATFAV